MLRERFRPAGDPGWDPVELGQLGKSGYRDRTVGAFVGADHDRLEPSRGFPFHLHQAQPAQSADGAQPRSHGSGVISGHRQTPRSRCNTPVLRTQRSHSLFRSAIGYQNLREVVTVRTQPVRMVVLRGETTGGMPGSPAARCARFDGSERWRSLGTVPRHITRMPLIKNPSGVPHAVRQRDCRRHDPTTGAAAGTLLPDRPNGHRGTCRCVGHRCAATQAVTDRVVGCPANGLLAPFRASSVSGSRAGSVSGR